MLTTGSLFGGAGATVISRASTVEAPSLSVTFSRIVFVPGVV